MLGGVSDPLWRHSWMSSLAFVKKAYEEWTSGAVSQRFICVARAFRKESNELAASIALCALHSAMSKDPSSDSLSEEERSAVRTMSIGVVRDEVARSYPELSSLLKDSADIDRTIDRVVTSNFEKYFGGLHVYASLVANNME